MNTQQDIIKIKKVTWAGVIVNTTLAIVKFICGFVGGSKAVVADAVHSLSDLGTDFAVLFGVQYWTKPADAEHPYGHGRIETFITAFISISLITVALGIGYNAVNALRNYNISHPTGIALIGAVLSIISKEGLYRWTLNVGKKVKSPSVIANAWHHRTDALSSIPVILAVSATLINKKWFFWDNIGAFVVSIFVLYSAVSLLVPVFSEFMGRGATMAENQKIRRIIKKVEGVKSTHAIRTRRRGPGWYVDLHIEVDPNLTVKQGHDIAAAVKYNLLDDGPDILDVIVHVEPFEQ